MQIKFTQGYCLLLKMNIIKLQNTPKPVLRGHLWDKKRWSIRTGDILIDIQLKCCFFQKNKCDILIQVTA